MKMYLLVFARPTICTHVFSSSSSAKALADRILIRPVVLRELLVHDRDARRVDVVVDAEVAALEEASCPIVSK